MVTIGSTANLFSVLHWGGSDLGCLGEKDGISFRGQLGFLCFLWDLNLFWSDHFEMY